MALGTEFDLQIHRGDDRQITGVVVDESDAPVDITGATFIYVVTALAPSTTPSQPQNVTALVTKTESAGIVITDAPNGAIRIDLGSGDTVGFTAPRDYYHELQITLGGFVTTIMFGQLQLLRDAITPGP